MGKDRYRLLLLILLLLGLGGLGLLVVSKFLPTAPGRPSSPPVTFAPTTPYTPWPTPPVAEMFGFPLLPPWTYGPYVQGVTGPLGVDTRYGVQNPAMGNRSNCFRDVQGDPVPFDQLYHAGIDLFALNVDGKVVWGEAAHEPVHAVADGVVIFIQDAGADGSIIIVEHRLVNGEAVYSVYWHTDYVQVEVGQPVERGQVIGLVLDLGLNSHLHWEIRTFRDGSELYLPEMAGGRGSCNGHFAGVGYTWDDVPERAHPRFYGYLDPIAFVLDHQ